MNNIQIKPLLRAPAVVLVIDNPVVAQVAQPPLYCWAPSPF